MNGLTQYLKSTWDEGLAINLASGFTTDAFHCRPDNLTALCLVFCFLCCLSAIPSDANNGMEEPDPIFASLWCRKHGKRICHGSHAGKLVATSCHLLGCLTQSFGCPTCAEDECVSVLPSSCCANHAQHCEIGHWPCAEPNVIPDVICPWLDNLTTHLTDCLLQQVKNKYGSVAMAWALCLPVCQCGLLLIDLPELLSPWAILQHDAHYPQQGLLEITMLMPLPLACGWKGREEGNKSAYC